MDDYGYRPKGTYLNAADWQGLYVLTGHWKSDLEFYRDDLKFLQQLIDKYFIWMVRKESLDEVREIESDLVEIARKCDQLIKRTIKHLTHLADLVEAPVDSPIFRAEHAGLEEDIAIFVKAFRTNRKEVFAITEHVMDTEKLSRLIKS
ncbi:MAG TPA: hypothetical protein VLZ54_05615 [Arenibacter sp.]|nr:hypothetical protein [Arenibacter sp.]